MTGMKLCRAATMVLALSAAIAAFSTPASAQGTYPKDEIFGGYSVLFPNGWEELDYKADTIPNAFDVSNVWYFCKLCDFGFILDGSGHYKGSTTPPNLDNGANSSTAIGYALAGLQYKWHNHKLMPFVRVLVGNANISPDCCSGTKWRFAAGGGGGLDIALSRRFSWRLIQADYLYTSYPHFYPSNHPQEWNSIRLATGIVINIGSNDASCLPQPKACTVTLTSPASVRAGEPVKLTTTGTGFDPKHPLQYSWHATGGRVGSAATSATDIDTTGLGPGSYSVTANLLDPKAKSNNSASCAAGFVILPPPTPIPPTLACAIAPAEVDTGRPATITLTPENPDKRPLTYAWSTTAGELQSHETTATITPRNEDAGKTITVTAKVTDDRGLSATCESKVRVHTLPPPCVEPLDWGSCQFVLNPNLPTRVDNECKDILDKLALQLQGRPNGKLVIVGSSAKDSKLAAQRAMNAKYYLTTGGSTRIDGDRIDSHMAATDELVHFYFVPAGELCSGHSELGSAVDESNVQGHDRGKLPHHKRKGAAPKQ